MPDETDPEDALPDWYPDALRGARLWFGGAAQSPGRMEEAAVRAVDEALRGVVQSPEDWPSFRGLFRSIGSGESPVRGRRMLGDVLRQAALGPDASPWRRNAAVLGLAILVVMEDRDPEEERYRRNPHLQQQLSGWRTVRRMPDGTEEERPWGNVSSRDDLVELLAPRKVQLDPRVRKFAVDVRDGVKPGGDDTQFIGEHRELVRVCTLLRTAREFFQPEMNNMVFWLAELCSRAILHIVKEKYPRDARNWPGVPVSSFEAYLVERNLAVVWLRDAANLGGASGGGLQPRPDLRSDEPADLDAVHRDLRERLRLGDLDALFAVPIRKATADRQELWDSLTSDDRLLLRRQAEMNIRSQARALRIERDTGGPVGGEQEPASCADRSLTRSGDIWTVRFDDSEPLPLKHSIGLEILATLLDNPHRDYPALELSGREDLEGTAGDLADDQALSEMRKAHDDAKAVGNTELAETIWEQMKKYVAPRGKRRKAVSDATEKARKSLSAAYNLVLRKLKEKRPALHSHLKAHVRVGVVSCYWPERGSPRWFVARHSS